MKYVKLAAIALTGAFWAGLASAESLGIYTHRQPFLLEPILEAYTKKTGVTFANGLCPKRFGCPP